MLTISLADYFDTKNREEKNTVAIEDLELRILQQILYTASGSELPYSRFSRINTIKRSFLSPILTIIWSVLSLFFVTNPQVLTNTPYWVTSSFFVWSAAIAWTVISIVGVEWLFHFFLSKSINKISLKNLEFERSKDDANSVLSKYFDEVLYFFESTEHEVVIFEDLDRFNTSQIFTKLRELNTLVNNNMGITRSIQFIYALKDSMFLSDERTKFFDFILPVVPVTGTANAEDTFIARNEELDEAIQLQKRYLQDIAQFITEPRVIHNVFNEYVVYQKAINTPNLDKGKLFALMTYKTLFVNDHEELLVGEGILYNVLTSSEKYRSEVRFKYETELNEIESRLANAQKEDLVSERLLVNQYIAELLRKGLARININGWFEVGNFKSLEELKEKIPYLPKDINGSNTSNQGVRINISLKTLENELHAGKTIDEKLRAIQDKSEKNKTLLIENRSKIQTKLSNLNHKRLKDLFVENDNLLSEFEPLRQNTESKKETKCPWQHIALVKYLLRHGYIDEQYYQYTTVFNNRPHYTVKDQNFYLHVQAQSPAKFDAEIDNPDEVIQRLSNIDFTSSSIFNVALLDELLENDLTENLSDFLNTIVNNYSKDGKEFIRHYIKQGLFLKPLAESMIAAWKDYLSIVFSENSMSEEASWLIGYLPPDIIGGINNNEMLLNALETAPDVYLVKHDDAPSLNALAIIEEYSINVSNIEKLMHVPEIMHTLLDNARYHITKENVHFALARTTTESNENIKVSTYDVLSNSGLEALNERVSEDLEVYLSSVMFQEPKNTGESQSSIVSLVNTESISDTTREKVIVQQDFIFPNLDEVKIGHELFFSARKVKPTWELLETFLKNKLVSNDILIEFVNEKTTIDSLLEELSNSEIVPSDSLKEHLVNADELSITHYTALCASLKLDKVSSWPDVSVDKYRVLLDLHLIELNEETYNDVKIYPDVLVTLILNERDVFLKTHEDLPTLDASHMELLIIGNDNDVLGKLLASLMNNYSVSDFSQDAEKLPQTYLLNPEESFEPNFAMQLLVISSNAQSIKALSKRLLGLWGHETFLEILTRDADSLSKRQIFLALEQFPSGSYCELTLQRKKPSFEINNLNLNFLDMLQKKGIIPSYNQEGSRFRVRRYRQW
jgi:hypothetical protein